MRKPTRAALLESAPWLPPPYELADVDAMKALAAGTATKNQQVRALAWILGPAAGRLDMSYRPGEDGRRDTDFAEGRRFVGNQVVKLINTDLSKLRRSNPRADPPEPKE